MRSPTEKMCNEKKGDWNASIAIPLGIGTSTVLFPISLVVSTAALTLIGWTDLYVLNSVRSWKKCRIDPESMHAFSDV